MVIVGVVRVVKDKMRLLLNQKKTKKIKMGTEERCPTCLG